MFVESSNDLLYFFHRLFRKSQSKMFKSLFLVLVKHVILTRAQNEKKIIFIKASGKMWMEFYFCSLCNWETETSAK